MHTTITLRAGDVISYQPENRWCHEGLAVASERPDGSLVITDTYWASYNPTVVKPIEFEVLFNLNEFEESSLWTWDKYAPEDQAVITSQHGLQRTLYVRKGADESLDWQIVRARDLVEDAQNKLRSAQSHLTWRESELASLIEKLAVTS